MSNREKVRQFINLIDGKEKEEQDLQDKIDAIRKQVDQIRTEKRQYKSQILTCKDEDFKEDGITGGLNQEYLSLAKTLVTVRTKDIDYTTTPITFFYYATDSQQNKQETLTKEELLKKISNGELTKVKEGDTVKPLPATVKFKELRLHKERLYVGATARGKLVLFESEKLLNLVEDTKYCITFNKRWDQYVVKEIKDPNEIRYRSRRRRRERYPRVNVLGYFNEIQEIVSYLV